MGEVDYDKYIIRVPDHPKKGITYYNYLSIYNDHLGFECLINSLVEFVKPFKPTAIFSPQPYGVILGSCVAYKLGLKFIIAYFNTNLSSDTYKLSFDYDFGTTSLEVLKNSLTKDDKVAIIDDVYATRGTMNACVDLINKFNAETVAIGVFLNLANYEEKYNKQINHSDIPLLKVFNV